MAKKINRLTTLKVNKLDVPGWYPDGAGLYLQVSKSGSKSWVYRYTFNKKERRLGLGSYVSTSMKQARLKCDAARQLKSDGIDPIEDKKQQELTKALEQSKNITFKECATAYIDSHKAGWKNPKHEMYWTNTLTTYAYSVIGELPVQNVDTGLVMKVIEPIWFTKTETASRVRQRIESILDWSKVREYRTGENPARWRGHIENLLPKATKVRRVKHFEAMPYMDLPAYFLELRKVETTAAKCLALTILTATRATEARECRWCEVDLKAKVWTVPPERMKGNKEHRVPLSAEALKILEEIKDYDEVLLFPGLKKDKSISEATVRKLLRKMHKVPTVHGFRSSFRDWCAEMTAFPREIAESALAHTLSSATEAAYQRGDFFVKRQKLMASWAKYCITVKKTADVIPLQREA